jgi:hypothetical protein
LVAIIILLSQFDNRFDHTNTNVQRIKAAIAVSPKDYLFVGPSYSYGGIFPGKFDSIGKDIYVLGVASAGPYYYELMLEDYLKSCKQKPKTVFICMDLAIASNKLDNWSAYPIHRYLNNPVSNESIFIKYVSLGTYASMLRRSCYKSLSQFSSKKNEAIQPNEMISVRGFSGSEEKLNASIYNKTKYLYTEFLNSEFDQQKVSCLFNLITKLKGMGINVILHEMPTYLLSQFLNETYKKSYDAFKIEISKKGIPLIIDQSNIHDSVYFSGIDHLNTYGAKSYTDFLIKRIKSLE